MTPIVLSAVSLALDDLRTEDTNIIFFYEWLYWSEHPTQKEMLSA